MFGSIFIASDVSCDKLSGKVHIFWMATNFCEISTVDLSYVRYVGGNYLPYTVKSTMEILQNFVALSEYMYEL